MSERLEGANESAGEACGRRGAERESVVIVPRATERSERAEEPPNGVSGVTLAFDPHFASGASASERSAAKGGMYGPARIRIAVTATRRPKDTKLPHRPAVVIESTGLLNPSVSPLTNESILSVP